MIDGNEILIYDHHDHLVLLVLDTLLVPQIPASILDVSEACLLQPLRPDKVYLLSLSLRRV